MAERRSRKRKKAEKPERVIGTVKSSASRASTGTASSTDSSGSIGRTLGRGIPEGPLRGAECAVHEASGDPSDLRRRRGQGRFVNIVAELTVKALRAHGGAAWPHYRDALITACRKAPPPFGTRAYGEIYRDVATDPGLDGGLAHEECRGGR